jgi:acyl-CoA thioester hydrolase
MDALQHVNNVVYLKWFESARLAYFDRVEFMAGMKTDNLGPILASSSIKYRAPLTYPDSILVGARAKDVSEDSMIQEYAVYSLGQSLKTTSGESRMVMYDFNHKCKAAIPDSIVANIKGLESNRH